MAAAYLQRTIVAKRAMIPPATMRAKMDGFLFLSNSNPIKPSSNDIGVPKMIASPPRAETGEPQPGLNTARAPMQAKQNTERMRAIRPTAPRGRSAVAPVVATGAFIWFAF